MPLFQADVRDYPGYRDYDVTADGQRFVLDRVTAVSGADPLTLVQNVLPKTR